MANAFVALSQEPAVSQEHKHDRVPELDGLRGFAILMVLSFHYFYDPVAHMPKLLHRLQRLFALGWTGVDLFFVLSGFLIFGVLLEARNSPSYFQTFYMRRCFRILPVYYLWTYFKRPAAEAV